MKISDLKQPYKRMAEYLGDENNTIRHSLSNYFFRFYNKMHKGDNPEITEEIKKYFPPDFDFSGEEDVINKFRLHTRDKFKNVEIPFNFNIFNSMLKKEVKDTFYLDAKEYYTQLAREGKFDQLPDTCEFIMPITLEVFDKETKMLGEKWIVGKFRGRYVSSGFNFYLGVKLPTPKIDFSEFKSGDVVEVELVHNETRIGWFDYVDNDYVVINVLKREGNQVCNLGSCAVDKEKIKSITKLK